MQRVFIYAYEEEYGGWHGMNNMQVIEVASLEIANEIGYEMAQEVIESYDCFDEEADLSDTLIWEVYKIKSDIQLSTRELDKICSQMGEEDFIEEYCEPDMWEVE